MQSPKSSMGKTGNLRLISSNEIIEDALCPFFHTLLSDGINKRAKEVVCSCLGSFLNWGEGFQKLSGEEWRGA